MKIQDARAMAIEAASRGWIRLSEVWDIAYLWTQRGHNTSLQDLFGDMLEPDKLEELSRVLLRSETMAATGSEVPPAAISTSLLPGRPIGPRYDVRETLGVGGAGEVFAAQDHQVKRLVALKTLKGLMARDPVVASRFVEEARVTAQLEHPAIIPVYDLGVTSDGEPFYTMRIVKQRSLRDVLSNREQRSRWPLVRLVGAIQQVARALAYAHSRGVMHRDIKPENVLLGDFGEVYLADWGLAKVDPTSPVCLHSDGSAPPPNVTDAGGTPGYMAPEVLRAERDKIGSAADVFALGVILYEILTGKRPFDSRNFSELFKQTCDTDPKRPSETDPSTPLVLEDLCLAMLAKRPKPRPSAEYVVSQIDAYLEGAKERARRAEEASRLAARADEPVARYRQIEAERLRLLTQAKDLLKSVKGWEPIERKRPAWALEDLAEKAEREAGIVLADAIDFYTQSLGYDATCERAHQGLADLYWSRARVAEEQRRVASQAYYEALVADHDRGTYGALLKANARLSLDTHPKGAHVIAQRYYERDRVLVPADEQYLGLTPVRRAKLAPGSYLVTIKREGYRDVRYPVLLARGAHHEATVNLYTDAEIGEGFVYIPASAAIVGGDPEANESLPRQEIAVDDFAIARFPVTMREYCMFLDHLQATDAALAAKRAPQDIAEGMAVLRGAKGLWEPSEIIIETEAARAMFPASEGHLWNVPANLVDWFDALAYCRWSSDAHRMPTEAEWEKAARGVDGRFFPWGDKFDPTFCKVNDSRPFFPQPEPNGTFPIDESPYGVHDMAGGMREWVGDIFGERTWSELCAEAEPDGERGESSLRRVRSGNWRADRQWARAASRNFLVSLTRGPGLGFRLAKSLRRD